MSNCFPKAHRSRNPLAETQALGGFRGLAGELNNVSQTDSGNVLDRSMAKQGEKLATKAADKSDKAAQGAEAEVTAYGSGNAAQVYFSLYPLGRSR